MIARIKATLKRIKHLPVDVQKTIKYNMRTGLLCACNKTTVPYFGSEEDGHGSVLQGGVRHGYTDCTVQ